MCNLYKIYNNFKILKIEYDFYDIKNKIKIVKNLKNK